MMMQIETLVNYSKKNNKRDIINIINFTATGIVLVVILNILFNFIFIFSLFMCILISF